MRYTVNVCLYGRPSVTDEQMISSPCNTEYACQSFENALQVGIPNPGKTGALDYCTADGGSFNGSKVNSCVKCLQSSADQTYLANFMLALKGGCDYRPNSETLLALSAPVFQSAEIKVLDPSAEASTTGNDSAPTMSAGAIAGIAIGAGLLFLGGTALFWIYYRKQKRMYRPDTRRISYPRMYEHGMPPPFMGGMGMRAGDVSSLHSKNASLASSHEVQMKMAPFFTHTVQRGVDRNFTNAAIGHTNYNFDPRQGAQGPHAALPTHPAYIPHTMSRAGLTRLPTPPEPTYQQQAEEVVEAEEAVQVQHQPPPPPQPQERQKPRTISQMSIFPQMSIAAHARVQAYVMNDSNSHPMPIQDVVPPAAVMASVNGSRGPSPALGNYNHHHHASLTPPRGPSPNDTPTARLLQGGSSVPSPPLPLPPAAARAPMLSMPALPKLRTAKQYTPPQVVMASRDDDGFGDGSGTGSLSPDCGPGESVMTIGLDIGNPLPQHRPRWANESGAGVGLPGQNVQQHYLHQQQQYGDAGEHHYQSNGGGGGWHGQGVTRNFSNPYTRARLPDWSRRETHFEDIETPASGMSERIYG